MKSKRSVDEIRKDLRKAYDDCCRVPDEKAAAAYEKYSKIHAEYVEAVGG